MADEVVPAATPAAEVAPAAAADVVAPAPAPAAEVAAVAEVAPPAEAPAAEVAPAAAARPVDLLKTAVAEGEKPADAPAEEKPAEEKPAEKPAEEKPAEKPADVPAESEKAAEVAQPQRLEPLAEYKYELPAEIVMNDDQRTSFHTAVENARNGEPQELINLHHQAMSDFAKRTRQGQVDSWNTTLQGWHEKTLEAFGGEEKFKGVAGRVAGMRDKFSSTEERGSEKWQNDMAEFNHMLDSTGVGNHPVMWRFMDRLAEALGEPRMPTILDPKPPANQRRGLESIHDHPRSPKPNGAS